MDILVITAGSLIIAQFMLHFTMKMLSNMENKACYSVNYRGKVIPAIGGMVFIPIIMFAVLLFLFPEPENSNNYIGYLALVISMGFAGIVDDLVGDRKIKGLINHMKSTLRGNTTTGFLKAFIGFVMACVITIGRAGNYIEFIVNVLIISLFANTINLFDLRPGRAAKVFLAASFILLTSAAGRLTEAIPLIFLNLAVLLYIRYDLREICMLGDTGANILGISLGYYSALLLEINSKLMLLFVLIFMNVIAEKLSISEIISRSRLLSYLDNLGRGETGAK